MSYPGTYEYDRAELAGHCQHGYPIGACQVCRRGYVEQPSQAAIDSLVEDSAGMTRADAGPDHEPDHYLRIDTALVECIERIIEVADGAGEMHRSEPNAVERLSASLDGIERLVSAARRHLAALDAAGKCPWCETPVVVGSVRIDDHGRRWHGACAEECETPGLRAAREEVRA